MDVNHNGWNYNERNYNRWKHNGWNYNGWNHNGWNYSGWNHNGRNHTVARVLYVKGEPFVERGTGDGERLPRRLADGGHAKLAVLSSLKFKIGWKLHAHHLIAGADIHKRHLRLLGSPLEVEALVFSLQLTGPSIEKVEDPRKGKIEPRDGRPELAPVDDHDSVKQKQELVHVPKEHEKSAAHPLHACDQHDEENEGDDDARAKHHEQAGDARLVQVVKPDDISVAILQWTGYKG
jgi:hypothetical protein